MCLVKFGVRGMPTNDADAIAVELPNYRARAQTRDRRAAYRIWHEANPALPCTDKETA